MTDHKTIFIFPQNFILKFKSILLNFWVIPYELLNSYLKSSITKMWPMENKYTHINSVFHFNHKIEYCNVYRSVHSSLNRPTQKYKRSITIGIRFNFVRWPPLLSPFVTSHPSVRFGRPLGVRLLRTCYLLLTSSISRNVSYILPLS